MVSKSALKKDNFQLLSNEILDQGATYFSIILLDDYRKILYYKSTNDKWQDKYVTKKYYTYCHLINRTNELIKSPTPSFTLAWDFVKCDNEIAKEIDLLRIENKISHGISFCNKNFHFNNQDATFLITLAGRECDINFSENVIKHKKQIMNSVINSNILQNSLTLKE